MITTRIVAAADCMTCARAPIADLLSENVMHGSIPLCRAHADLLEESAALIERILTSPISETGADRG